MSTTVRFLFLSPYDVVRVEKQKVALEREGIKSEQEETEKLYCDYYYSYQAFLGGEGGDAQLQPFRSLVAVVRAQWDPVFSEGNDDETNSTCSAGGGVDSTAADPVMIAAPTLVCELYKKAEAAISQDLASLGRYAHAQRTADASLKSLSTRSSALAPGAQSTEGHAIWSIKLGLVSDTALEVGEARRRIVSKNSPRPEDKEDNIEVGEGDAESNQPSLFLPSSLRPIQMLDDLDVPLSCVMRKGDTVSVILEF